MHLIETLKYKMSLVYLSAAAVVVVEKLDVYRRLCVRYSLALTLFIHSWSNSPDAS